MARRKRAKRNKDAKRNAPRQGMYARSFDRAIARHLITRVTTWPEHRRDAQELLEYTERFLRVGDRVVGFHPFAAATFPNESALDEGLAATLRDLAQTSPVGQDIHAAIPEDEAARIWATMCARMDELPDLPERWRAPADLDAWELFELVCVLAAEGMTYTTGIFGEDLNFEISQHAQRWYEGLELLLVSFLKVLTVDMRALTWLARQPLERGLDGLCRHYSLVVQLLFDVACRALDAHPQHHVVTITGTHNLAMRYDHAWTWFVDEAEDMIIPVDLTGADWLYDRAMTTSIFNQGFNALQFANTSAFLNTIIQRSLLTHDALLRVDQVRALLPRMIDRETVHGQAVLCNIAAQNVVPRDVRARILAYLDDSPAAPHLAAQIERARSSKGVTKISGEMITGDILHEHLDALGL